MKAPVISDVNLGINPSLWEGKIVGGGQKSVTFSFGDDTINKKT